MRIDHSGPEKLWIFVMNVIDLDIFILFLTKLSRNINKKIICHQFHESKNNFPYYNTSS